MSAVVLVALLAQAVASASPILIYDNSSSAFAGTTFFTAFQQGDEIHAAGIARIVTLLEIGVNEQGIPGSADLQARLYANDSPAGMPGTLLWQSDLLDNAPLSGGSDLIPFVVPRVLVPDIFTWTLQISDASPRAAAGLPVFGPASIGSSPAIAWFGDGVSWGTVGSPSFPVNFLARVSADSVPEPSAMSLLGLGLACSVSFCKTRKRTGERESSISRTRKRSR